MTSPRHTRYVQELRNIRDQTGLTLADFGHYLGVTGVEVHRYETGAVRIREPIIRLARYLLEQHQRGRIHPSPQQLTVGWPKGRPRPRRTTRHDPHQEEEPTHASGAPATHQLADGGDPGAP